MGHLLGKGLGFEMGKLRPSVCIDAVFENLADSLAIAEVEKAGLTAFEFWGWWDRDLPNLLQAKRKCQLEISACCTHFITLTDPALREKYLEGLEQSIEAAGRLGCKTLISQVGDEITDKPRYSQHLSLVEGLREAAPLLEAADVTLVIEPLNRLVNHPGYYLVGSSEAFDIVESVGSESVKVVFDIYHQQVSEGNVIHNLVSNIDKIGHFHAAGNPGRNELTRGELNYRQIFESIQSTNYDGYVGLEYWPVDDPLEGLCEIASWFE